MENGDNNETGIVEKAGLGSFRTYSSLRAVEANPCPVGAYYAVKKHDKAIRK